MSLTWVDTKTRLMPYSLVTKEEKKNHRPIIVFFNPLQTFYSEDAKQMRMKMCYVQPKKPPNRRFCRKIMFPIVFKTKVLRARSLKKMSLLALQSVLSQRQMKTALRIQRGSACLPPLWFPLRITGVLPTTIPAEGRHGHYFPSSCDSLD